MIYDEKNGAIQKMKDSRKDSLELQDNSQHVGTLETVILVCFLQLDIHLPSSAPHQAPNSIKYWLLHIL